MTGKKYTLPNRFKKLTLDNEQVKALVSWYEKRLRTQTNCIKRLGLEIQEKAQKIKLIKFILEK